MMAQEDAGAAETAAAAAEAEAEQAKMDAAAAAAEADQAKMDAAAAQAAADAAQAELDAEPEPDPEPTGPATVGTAEGGAGRAAAEPVLMTSAKEQCNRYRKWPHDYQSGIGMADGRC